jgi:hypothetical protein
MTSEQREKPIDKLIKEVGSSIDFFGAKELLMQAGVDEALAHFLTQRILVGANRTISDWETETA